MESRIGKAEELFREGYNCSQAVFLAYADLVGIDFDTAKKLSCGFGGGMGRMRDTCGAVSAMVLLTGFFEGMEDGADAEGKKRNYALVQKLVNRFKEMYGSYNCQELLGILAKEKSSTPEARTEEYYKVRPCIRHILAAARILEEELFNGEHGY